MPEAPFRGQTSFYRKAGPQEAYVEEIVTDFVPLPVGQNRHLLTMQRLQGRVGIDVNDLKAEIQTGPEILKGTRHVVAQVAVRTPIQYKTHTHDLLLSAVSPCHPAR